MTREELLALAARVEAAEGADRELDAMAWVAAFDPSALFGSATVEEVWPGGSTREALHTAHGSRWADECEPPVGHYTSSIDAAASLVPKGCEALVRWRRSAATLAINAYAHVWPIDGPMPFPAWESRAHSAARALTAAALRAHAEEAGE